MTFKLKHYILEKDESVFAQLEYWFSGGEFIIKVLWEILVLETKKNFIIGLKSRGSGYLSSLLAQHLFLLFLGIGSSDFFSVFFLWDRTYTEALELHTWPRLGQSAYRSRSQAWVCIRVTWKACTTQYAGPYSQIFWFTGSGMGPENMYCISNTISGNIAGDSLGTTLCQPLVHSNLLATEIGSWVGSLWNSMEFNFMTFIEFTRNKNLCFCRICSFQM